MYLFMQLKTTTKWRTTVLMRIWSTRSELRNKPNPALSQRKLRLLPKVSAFQVKALYVYCRKLKTKPPDMSQSTERKLRSLCSYQQK